MIRPPEYLETERLALRRPAPADGSAIFERWATDPQVTRYLAWAPHRDVSESEAHVARCIERWQSGEEYVWLIDELDTGTLVGSIAARVRVHGVDIGYLLARDAWGRGYMVEAVNAVTDWFLARPEVHRVWATCDAENLASARVLEQASFELEGVLRRWQPHPGAGEGPRDARCYSRIR
jgi:RimJ/RimL family protein N-acetyltransferase